MINAGDYFDEARIAELQGAGLSEESAVAMAVELDPAEPTRASRHVDYETDASDPPRVIRSVPGEPITEMRPVGRPFREGMAVGPGEHLAAVLSSHTNVRVCSVNQTLTTDPILINFLARVLADHFGVDGYMPLFKRENAAREVLEGLSMLGLVRIVR